MADQTLPNLSRRTLILSAFLLAAPAGRAFAVSCAPTRVLLVCPAGTVKSAIARETLKRRALERRIPLQAESRGLSPADHISPGLAAHLRADGVDPGAQPVRRLESADLKGVDIVIAFDDAAAAPGLRGARIWSTPSWNDDYAAAKAALAPQVEALLDELSARGCGRG